MTDEVDPKVEIVHSGMWWLPEDPNRRVPGHLVRSDDGWLLATIGLLEVHESQPDRDKGIRVESQTIFGCTRSGSVSLWSCCRRSTTVGGGQRVDDLGERQGTQTWMVSMVIVGRTIEPTHVFSVAGIAMNGLTEWWLARTHQMPTDPDLEDLAPDRPPITFELEGGWSVTLSTGGSSTRGQHRWLATRQTYIWVECADGFTHDALYRRVVFPFRALVAMTLGQRVEVFEERLRPKDARSEYEELHPEYLEPGGVHLPDGPADHEQVLFTPQDIDPIQFLPRWLNLADRAVVPLGAVVTQGDGTKVLQIAVVELIMAAETLDRALHPDAEEEPEIVQRLFKALKEGTFNSRERRRLRNVVANGCGLKLEARLRRLVAELTEPVEQYLLGSDNASHWAQVAAAIRNALTHGLPAQHRLHEDVNAMLAVHAVTRRVIELTLAVSCGLPAGDRLVQRLDRIHRYRSVANQEVVDWAELAARIGGSSP